MGKSSADDLAHRGEVRRDAVELLRSAGSDAEAGHHLVEDEERVISGAEFAQPTEITWQRAEHSPYCRRRARRSPPRSDPRVHGKLLDRFDAIEGEGYRGVAETFGHAGRIGKT